MVTPENGREPCPDRILDDIGGAFGMGALGGSAFHFIKGTYNSPKGQRFTGGTQAVRMNAPRVGGSFAVWGGLFSCADCSMVYMRQKEDPWNSIIAGVATGGFLQMRQGARTATRSALFGGALLALIEGAGIMFNKFLTPPPGAPEPVMGQFPGFGTVPGEGQVVVEESSGGWFGGLFGSGKKEEEASSSKGKSEVLESFETPSTAVPSFEFK